VATTIYWFRGDEDVIQFTLQRGGSAVDLTGATAKFTVRLTDADGAQQFQYSATQGGAPGNPTFPTPASGRVDVTLLDGDTDGLDPDLTYVWDLEITLTSGKVLTYPRDALGRPDTGILSIAADVTHA